MLVWAHLHNLPFKEGCDGRLVGAVGVLKAGVCTKCPLCILRIGKMPCRGWFECVFVWMFICVCMCVCEPHLSGEPEGSDETTVMRASRPLYVWMCVCVKQIKSRKLYEDRRELQNLWAISVYQCPNCFPLLTWLETNRTIFSVAVKVTHTQKLTLTPPHFLPHSAITTPSCSSMIGLLLAFMPKK